MKRKAISICLTAILSLSTLFHSNDIALADESGNTGYKEHFIKAGDSFDGNPLKGFVPYDELTTGITTDFPHSMEWFYIPVKEVQTGMDSFDWTKLEERLNAVAARGHQAAFRLYYDYPSLDSGVPQFLIDAGLEMRYYDEPDNLGGDGYCPDYNNEDLRTSMINLIYAFGEEYDGDPRIGCITLGLLGFWGEWHTWPYDEDTSDEKPNWNIPTELYTDVLKAYDEAFNTTLLCAREPKWGVDNETPDVGFHDDSFAYATLSAETGGQTWSFMQKLLELKVQDKWKTNVIGGEIYPSCQPMIFKNENWEGESGQSWADCLEQTHVTWLMNEKIKTYTGVELEAAKTVAKQMGYDFRVDKAYFKDILEDDSLYLKIDIKNIGIAPFYYNHTMWPVAIGVMRDGELVKSWNTTWDLNTIPADATISSFGYTVDAIDLENGAYNIGIKVINPLENGNILGFANAGQRADGWLVLGSITVSNASNTDTTSVNSENASSDLPKTGDGNIMTFVYLLMMMIAVGGIALIKTIGKRNKRIQRVW
ncbi:MAG: hypothetical protein K0R46_232 [Herbinix sp.]|jgi:hypothetical protein|nr:hypothetical protein [Herbinix sp.]